jgi:hypothetical protein
MLLVSAGFSVGSSAHAQAPDNAVANRPGSAPDANRADQQGSSAADREITRKIRKSIIADNPFPRRRTTSRSFHEMAW